MEFINPIAAIIALIVAIFSIPKTLHAIGEHKRKKFKDELENFTEYFEKFYRVDTDKYPRLLRDKAAQNISRSIDMSSDLLHHLIDLHENDLANFDRTTEQYYWGSRFIDIRKQDNKIIYSKKRRVSKLISRIYYFLYAIFLIFAIVIFTGKFHFWNIQWLDGLIGFSFIIFSISALRKGDDMKEALKFLATITNAEITQATTNSLVQHNDQVDMAS
ncbi:hypothetical protein [Acinetobacter albensis]|uniref:Uncharacterized protein n=1 Tax=Acinetobacter albensis TaxID=1673609 RepID=A0A1C4GVD8_9GAMM|nr:hypothetical protein [Acinetobacter albensis]SCC71825.1 hypothetical protein GA0116959_10645 [Acinetobacter albensis]